jgi:hypothetical protein
MDRLFFLCAEPADWPADDLRARQRIPVVRRENMGIAKTGQGRFYAVFLAVFRVFDPKRPSPRPPREKRVARIRREMPVAKKSEAAWQGGLA